MAAAPARSSALSNIEYAVKNGALSNGASSNGDGVWVAHYVAAM